MGTGDWNPEINLFFKSHFGLKILTKFCSPHWPIFYLNLVKTHTNTFFFLTWDEMGCLARPWVAFAISFIPDVILVGGLEKTRPPKEGGMIHRPGPGPSVIRSHPHWHKSGMTRGAMALWTWAQNQHPWRRTITWVHDDGTGGGSENLMTRGGQAPEECKVCSCGYKAHCLFTQKEPF